MEKITLQWFRRRPRKTQTSDAVSGPSPSSRRFFWMEGRRHSAAAPYVLPNDIQEINRLDLQHFLFRYVLQRHYTAPIRYPISVLDVGTGTGRWAKEVAQAFPESNVIGVDIVPPEVTADTPRNSVFLPGNVLEGLSFDQGSFQLVHQRMLFLAIPLAQWPTVVQDLTRITALGGWVELLEAGIVHNGGPAMTALMNWGTQLTGKRGIDVHVGAQLGNFLRQAGLEHVTYSKIDVPVGAYGGRLGMMMKTDVMAVVTALRGPVVAQGLATADEYDHALVAANEETQQGPWQGVWPIHVAYGQRQR